MVDIATHIRIFDAEPTDDLVEKRTSAIQDLSKVFAKHRSIPKILKLANDLSSSVAAKGIMPTEMANEVEAAIKEYSPSFIQADNQLQMLVCALLAMLQYLDAAIPSKGKLTGTDVLAVGLWSALSFQKSRPEAKLESLRADLLSRSQSIIAATSSNARNRITVPDFSFDVPETPDFNTYSEAQIKGASKTIKALRSNSALDREELDILWWVLSDWSSLLNDRLSSLPAEASAISRGIEVACLLRRLPGDAHKHLVLKGIAEGDSLSLSNLIKELADNREKLASNFEGDTNVETCPAVFPLLSALSTGKVGAAGRTKCSLYDWAVRALLERAILHVSLLQNSAEI